MRRIARTLLAGLALVGALAGSSRAQDPLGPPPPVSPPPLPPAVPPAPPPPVLTDGQKENGVAVELHLGSSVINLNGGGTGGAIPLGVLEGGVFVGYKYGRFIAGLGFDLQRVATGMSGSMQPDTSQAGTSILFLPGLQVAALRTSDGKVELFGELDLGFGHTFNDQNPSPAPPQPDKSNFRFTYQIGPGLRYWIAPQLAFAGLVALHGDFTTASTSMMTNAGTINTSTSSGVTSIVAAFKLLGVF